MEKSWKEASGEGSPLTPEADNSATSVLPDTESSELIIHPFGMYLRRWQGLRDPTKDGPDPVDHPHIPNTPPD